MPADHNTLPRVTESLHDGQRAFEAGQGHRWWLSLRESPGEVIGSVHLSNVVRGPFQSCNLGYALDASLQGFGLMHEALRAVLRRANARLGTNWTMHDLRHTCALRMAADENVSLRDVQTILGHAHMETTAEIYLVEDERHTVEKVAAHLARLQEPKPDPAPVATAYRSADLAVLFGDGLLP